MYTPLKPIPMEDALRRGHVYWTGHLAEGGRPNFWIQRTVTQIHLLRQKSVNDL